jgi:hypothetical protein
MLQYFLGASSFVLHEFKIKWDMLKGHQGAWKQNGISLSTMFPSLLVYNNVASLNELGSSIEKPL